MYIQCINWSVRQCIKYCIGGAIGLGGYRLSINPVYLIVSPTAYQILYGSCYWIRRIKIEYSSDVCIGQPDTKGEVRIYMNIAIPHDSNIMLVFGCNGHPAIGCINIKNGGLCSGRCIGNPHKAVKKGTTVGWKFIGINLRID
jgi:hypothetical protein